MLRVLVYNDIRLYEPVEGNVEEKPKKNGNKFLIFVMFLLFSVKVNLL